MVKKAKERFDITVMPYERSDFTNAMEQFVDEIADRVVGKLDEKRVPAIPEVVFTLEQLFDAYVKDYAKPHLKTWRNMERCFESYFGDLRHRDALSITRQEIQQFHNSLAENIGWTTANRACQLLQSVYNRCIDWGLIPNHNPASKMKMKKLKSRERFLLPNELSSFFAALKTLRNPTTRDVFLTCLLTGQRLGNVRLMRWDELSLDLGIWIIPETKNGTSHKIPLVPEAISLLKNRQAKTRSQWVFPSRLSELEPISRVDNAWQKVVSRAGLKNLRLHDLRRSLASYEAITGANISVIAHTLNHKDLASTAIYARLHLEPVRQAMERAIDEMLSHAGIDFDFGDLGENNELTPESLIAPSIVSADDLVTADQAALILDVSESVLGQMRLKNSGPPYIKMGFSVFYSKKMLNAVPKSLKTAVNADPRQKEFILLKRKQILEKLRLGSKSKSQLHSALAGSRFDLPTVLDEMMREGLICRVKGRDPANIRSNRVWRYYLQQFDDN